MSFLTDFVLAPLAQAAAPAAPQGGGDGGIPLPYIMIAILFAAGYMFIIAPERKKQRAIRDQLAGIKKNDRVVTIGGIYGVVANVNRDADKVTLKVDDNTKMDFTLSAISRVLTPDAGGDKDKDKKDAS